MDERTTAVEAPRAAESPRPTLAVLATTEEGTRCALESAKRLTGSVDARVVLLVPVVQPYSIPFDPDNDNRNARAHEHRALAARVGVNVTVLVCVCQRLEDVVHQMLGRSSPVLVGGRRRSWWPTREQRLVRRLIGEGYPVVFAQVGATPVQARGMAAAL